MERNALLEFLKINLPFMADGIHTGFTIPVMTKGGKFS